MSAMDMQPIHIFKPGRHTPMRGPAISFGASDLEATVQAYDPAKHRAPICKGHPEHDAPAFGWIEGLSLVDGDIEATPAHVDPAFAAEVKDKKWRNVSAAFFRPDSPQNPVPGVWYLKHVAMLGAWPPAVQGLREPGFAGADDGVVVFGSAWTDASIAGLFRRLRDWLISTQSLGVADQVIPPYDIESIERSAQRDLEAAMAEPVPATPQSTPPAFGAPSDVTPAQAEIEALRRQLAEAEQRAQQLRTDQERQAVEAAFAAARADAVAFVADLVSQARLPAAAAGVIGEVLAELARPEREAVAFGSGTETVPLADALRTQLAALPPMVAFGAAVTAGRARPQQGESPREIARRATDWADEQARAGRVVSSAEAVAHVLTHR